MEGAGVVNWELLEWYFVQEGEVMGRKISKFNETVEWTVNFQDISSF